MPQPQGNFVVTPPEALLASIGVRPVATHAVETITPAQEDEARDIHDIVTAEARRCVYGKSPMPAVEKLPYFPLLQALSQPYEPHQVEAMIAALGQPLGAVFGKGFVETALTAFNYLSSTLPRVAKHTILASGGRGSNSLPAQAQLQLFHLVYQVLEHPLGVYGLICHNRLLPRQIRAMDAVYPTLLVFLRQELLSAMLARKSRQLSWSPSHSFGLGVRTLLGRSLGNPVPPPPEVPLTPPSKSKPNKSIAASESRTPPQQAAHTE